jgi:hypothetical protein
MSGDLGADGRSGQSAFMSVEARSFVQRGPRVMTLASSQLGNFDTYQYVNLTILTYINVSKARAHEN